DVRVSGLNAGSAQGDRRVAEILERMGAVLSSTGGVTRARPSMNGLRGTEIDARDIPDIVPPLAALACFAKGTTLFTGAGRLRLKESDRIAALAEELAKLGAGIEETPDGLCIAGKDRLKGGDVCAHGDHRIAMALAVASLGCEGSVRLDGAECVGKSYPGFWEDWERK
ncbi:MAG: 3-phosphoshikimate 1-carboxyvinyltransferase, partial [Defluviitaleaceae bacterium]|nr:3-phosphoshikimate 1-carboxyvinyltransferase [Defluviitaleaceae bacterium]